MNSMNQSQPGPWSQGYDPWSHGHAHDYGCGNRASRYIRALGVALIIFGAVAHGRMDFFWAGVVLTACSGLL